MSRYPLQRGVIYVRPDELLGSNNLFTSSRRCVRLLR